MSPLAKNLHQKSIENSPIDLRLKRMSTEILPESPYILTIPSTYRVKETQVNDWKRGCPFGADEEQLQYLSFNAPNRDDTILTAVKDWDDGHGGLVEKMSSSNSGTLSPFPGVAPRRKITLQDYSNRATKQVGAKVIPAVNGEDKVPEKVIAPVAPAVKEVQPTKEDQPHGQKRYRDAPAAVIVQKRLVLIQEQTCRSCRTRPALECHQSRSISSASQKGTDFSRATTQTHKTTNTTSTFTYTTSYY